jgi:hypothetical protein
MLEARLLLRWVWLGVVALLLIGGCTKKKVTAPSPTGPFRMTEYFPLNPGSQWSWRIQVDTVPEPFEDGDVNLGEPFVDLNKDGFYDLGESYQDLNFNGRYDGPNDPWSDGVPYLDRNHNGQFDPPNSKWDEGETFTDLDSNGEYSTWSTSFLTGKISEDTTVSADGSTLFQRRSLSFKRSLFFYVYWVEVDTTDDQFSNDSLGLRWHSHLTSDAFSPQDDLKEYGPVVIARAQMGVGDSMISMDSSGVRVWISILTDVEDVTVSAGYFTNCLKFKWVTSGWTGNMQECNGTSWAWYAKDVGLLKLEKANGSVHWQLESVIISQRSFL